jgi:general stress protein YciG
MTDTKNSVDAEWMEVKNMIEPTETDNLPTEEGPANGEPTSVEMPVTPKRGFLAMSPERLKQITSQGGKAAHAAGLANKFTTETAREAGKVGGAKTSADRAHMAEIGRLGGLAKHKKRVAATEGGQS